MSERSMLQEEYESLSAVLRNLNRIVITARRQIGPTSDRVMLPLDSGSLAKDLQYVAATFRLEKSRAGKSHDAPEVLDELSLQEDEVVSQQLEQIRTRLSEGDVVLSRSDLDVLDALAGALDKASAVLFERIQAR